MLHLWYQGAALFWYRFFSICLQDDIREENSFISYINRVIPIGTADDWIIHETEIGETTSGRRTLFPRFYNMFRGFVRA